MKVFVRRRKARKNKNHHRSAGSDRLFLSDKVGAFWDFHDYHRVDKTMLIIMIANVYLSAYHYYRYDKRKFSINRSMNVMPNIQTDKLINLELYFSAVAPF